MADTSTRVLKTFQEYYLKNDFSNALLWLKDRQNEISPALWHYNMGTVEAKLKNYPIARYHLMLAKEAGLQTAQLRQNLKYVNSKLDIDRLEESVQLSDFMMKGLLLATHGPFLTLSLVIGIVSMMWVKKKKSSVINIVLLLLGTLAPLVINQWIKSWPKEIVFASHQIFEGPSVLFSPVGELPTGVMVVTNRRGDWKKIIYPSKYSGWIRDHGLKKLELK